MLRNLISKRKPILISLGLLALAATTIALMPKGALAEEGVPIKGTFSVTITLITSPSSCGTGDNCITCVTNPQTPGVYIEAQGIGDTSKLGALFFEVQKCLNPAGGLFGTYEGTFTMTAPNGKDSLTGTYTGKNTSALDPYNFVPFSGELKITGGTGKFDDARGSVRFTAVANGKNFMAFYAVEGSVLSRGD